MPYEAGAEPPQQAAAGQQHPALAGGAGAYRPGFWNKTVPENSPLSMGNPLPAMLCADSPGSVSMELTQPTLMLPAQQQHQQHQPGEVTAGLPSLGALAEADELEGAEEEAPPAAVPGEVTATLPSLGALADEWEQEEGQRQGLAGDGWAVGAPADANVTANITAALPGLDALVAEDEDATAGMDLTVPAGRVLEHYLQQQQQQQASPAPTLAAAPSPAAAPVAIPSPGQQQLEGQHPALAAPEAAPPAGELEPTVAVGGATGHLSMGRLSVGPEELAAAKAGQMNKWGFAPGQEDTLDINLELHGALWWDAGDEWEQHAVARRGSPGLPAHPHMRRPYDHGRPDLQPAVLRQHDRRQPPGRSRCPWRCRRHQRLAAPARHGGGGGWRNRALACSGGALARSTLSGASGARSAGRAFWRARAAGVPAAVHAGACGQRRAVGPPRAGAQP